MRSVWRWTLIAALIGAPLFGCDTANEAGDATNGGQTGGDGNGTGGGDTGTPGGDTSTPGAEDDGTLAVTGFNAKAVGPGSNYTQITLDGIPPYSFAVADFTIGNISSGPVVIHAVTLTPVAPTEAYEWTVNEPGTVSKKPLPISEQTIPAGMALEFGLYFNPLASGPRNVQVAITYGEGKSYSFTVEARGRDNATLSPVVSSGLERLFGRSNVAKSNGVQPGGLAADAAGNVYFNVNASEWDDKFNVNLVLARVSATGSLDWVRELQEDYIQECRDIGDNGEVGGGQDSIAVDGEGDVYVGAQRSLTSTAAFQALAMRVDGATGDLMWAEGLTTGAEPSPKTAAAVLRGQSVDASLADRVLIAGQVADSSGAFLIALDKTDGSIIWARTFMVGGVHRIASLAVDGGSAYLGGIAANAPVIIRVDGVDGDAPSIAWARQYAPSFANVHALIPNGDGLLAAIDVRGATTMFVGARIAKSDGAVVWSKVWDAANAGDNNNTMTVAVHDGRAIFAGRIAFTPFDTQGGEGFLLALDPVTGAYAWGSFYYGGKGAEELVFDYVTSLVSTTQGLWAVHQQTPGSKNQHHFWGRWYQANDATLELPGGDGSGRLADAGVTASASAAVDLTELLDATVHPVEDADLLWSDQTSTVDLLEPVQAETDGYQTGTHVLLQRLVISP